VALVAACGTSNAPSQPSGLQSATVTFQIPQANFEGNSVRICGSRSPPADGKYPCFNDLTTATGSQTQTVVAPPNAPTGPAVDCPCFTFNGTGGLVDLVNSSETFNPMSGVTNLCPSVDLAENGGGEGAWTFEYSLFTDEACGALGGQLLNTMDNAHNFVCFDTRDLEARANPNETSGETLEVGPNANHIVCSTVNANKTFDFSSCVLSCATPDGMPATDSMGAPITPMGTNPTCPEGTANVYSCTGCEMANSASGILPSNDPQPATGCTCASGAIDESALPNGCTFMNVAGASTCAIVCTVPGQTPEAMFEKDLEDALYMNCTVPPGSNVATCADCSQGEIGTLAVNTGDACFQTNLNNPTSCIVDCSISLEQLLDDLASRGFTCEKSANFFSEPFDCLCGATSGESMLTVIGGHTCSAMPLSAEPTCEFELTCSP